MKEIDKTKIKETVVEFEPIYSPNRIGENLHGTLRYTLELGAFEIRVWSEQGPEMKPDILFRGSRVYVCTVTNAVTVKNENGEYKTVFVRADNIPKLEAFT